MYKKEEEWGWFIDTEFYTEEKEQKQEKELFAIKDILSLLLMPEYFNPYYLLKTFSRVFGIKCNYLDLDT